MEAQPLWEPEDLANPGSRGWKGRFARWVEGAYPDLGVYAVVGKLPRPMCFVYPRDFAVALQNLRPTPGDTSRGERWALCCSRAKFAVFVGSGGPELTWGVASRDGEQGEIGFGFYIENGYEELPPEKTVSPFRDEAIDHSFFVRDDQWDWNRFRSAILDSQTGRSIVTDLMRTWDRPLFIRLGPVDPVETSTARRYWFDSGQLCRNEESAPDRVTHSTEIEMWDWISQRADHRTAWFNVMLLEFVRHQGGRVDPGSAERVVKLLDALRPLLRLCWSRA
jgi:hypothetical protein